MPSTASMGLPMSCWSCSAAPRTISRGDLPFDEERLERLPPLLPPDEPCLDPRPEELFVDDDERPLLLDPPPEELFFEEDDERPPLFPELFLDFDSAMVISIHRGQWHALLLPHDLGLFGLALAGNGKTVEQRVLAARALLGRDPPLRLVDLELDHLSPDVLLVVELTVRLLGELLAHPDRPPGGGQRQQHEFLEQAHVSPRGRVRQSCAGEAAPCT